MLDAANCGDAIVDRVVLEQNTVMKTRHNPTLDKLLESGAADDVVVVHDASIVRPYSAAVVVVAAELRDDVHPSGASVDQGSVAFLAKGYESGHVPFQGDMNRCPFLMGNPKTKGWEQGHHLGGRQGESPYVHSPWSESVHGAIPCGIGSYLECPSVTCPKTTCGHVLDAYGVASSLRDRVD